MKPVRKAVIDQADDIIDGALDASTRAERFAHLIGAYFDAPRSEDERARGALVYALAWRLSAYRMPLTPEATHFAASSDAQVPGRHASLFRRGLHRLAQALPRRLQVRTGSRADSQREEVDRVHRAAGALIDGAPRHAYLDIIEGRR